MKKGIIYIILLVALIACWQYCGSTNKIVRLLISSPLLILDYIKNNGVEMFQATYTTFIEAILGLLIAMIFSFGMMILCFYKPKFMDFILPIMITSQVIPLIVLAPFFIILFGIGISSKVAMAALMCFFPVFVNFAQGYRSISTNIHELMHTYNASLNFRIWNVYFPLSAPSILSGLKVSSTLAVIGAIVAEFNGAETGLGRNLFLSAKRLEPDLMMASLLLSIVLGAFFFLFIFLVENKIGKWFL